MGAYFAFSLLIFVLIFLRSQCIRRLRANSYETVYTDILLNKNNAGDNQLIGESEIQMRDSDVWSHAQDVPCRVEFYIVPLVHSSEFPE